MPASPQGFRWCGCLAAGGDELSVGWRCAAVHSLVPGDALARLRQQHLRLPQRPVHIELLVDCFASFEWYRGVAEW
jgi:hypothetical protein